MAVKEKDKKAGKDDAASKYEAGKDEAKKKYEAKNDDDAAEETEGKGKATKSGPSLGAKIFRVSVFTFLATFLTAFLFADPIPNGLRVDFDLLASLKLGLISAVIAAVLRAVAGMLPVFADD